MKPAYIYLHLFLQMVESNSASFTLKSGSLKCRKVCRDTHGYGRSILSFKTKDTMPAISPLSYQECAYEVD